MRQVDSTVRVEVETIGVVDKAEYSETGLEDAVGEGVSAGSMKALAAVEVELD